VVNARIRPLWSFNKRASGRGYVAAWPAHDLMALQPAPSAHRAVDIVRFLADHPGEVFAAADLARRVGQSRATCQAVLLALEPPQWVRRSEDGYTLGSGLIAIGAAARQGAAIVGLLRSAVHDLYRTIGSEAVGYLPAGDQLINVSRAGPNLPLSVTVTEGQTFPLAPPYGLAFAAWNDTDLDNWTARLPNPTKRSTARLKRAAAIVRELGYSILLDPAARRELESRVKELSEARQQLLARALDHDELLDVDRKSASAMRASFLSAPVFGSDGNVVALLGVVLGIDQCARVHELAASLLAACARLGDILGAPPGRTGYERSA
jgi:DNA-binding IclR family transcriptional regulator